MALQSGPKIVIVGAGLGGLALALSLKSYGIPSTIFEVRPNPVSNHDSNLDGGYLALAPNALRVLDKIDVYKTIQPQGYNYDEMHFLSGRNMSQLGAARTGSVQHFGYPALRISRHILRQTLLDKVAQQGVEVKYNCKLVDLQDDNSNVNEGGTSAIKATFSEGTVEQADYVIGADGIHSRVRRFVDPTAGEPTFSGQIGLGGAVELAKLSADNQKTTMPCMIIGAANSFACIPISYDGSRLGCFATIEKENRSRSEWNDLAADKTGLLRSLQQAHCDEKSTWPHFVQESCMKMDQETMAIWPFHKAPKVDSWISSSGRAILIGDAAHAIPPTGGQGAAMAFEDSASLSLAFANEFKTTPSQSSSAVNSSQFPNLQMWLSNRRSRIEKIVAFTDRGGNMRKATPSVFMQVVKEWGMWLFFLVKGKEAGVSWIYSYDVHA